MLRSPPTDGSRAVRSRASQGQLTSHPLPACPRSFARRSVALISAGLIATSLWVVTLAPSAARADDLRQPPSQTVPPRQHRLSASAVIAIANRQPKVRAEQRRRRGVLQPVAYMKGSDEWQVSYFQGRAERAQVLIFDPNGRVLEAWTGIQVAWTMARGYPGAFAGKVTALYVWLPLSLLFMLPFVDFRRPFRLLHLDLAVLLAFGVSLAFFDRGNVGASVPLVYPVLGYLLVRLLIGAMRPRRQRGRVIPHVPITWLALGLVFLTCFRVALNVADSSVVDIGYASVVGADRIVHGENLYGKGWPKDIQQGDTYGPVAYLAYVPFNAIFGFSGHWDNLPAAHAAAITFDVLTALCLFLLGRRMRAGPAGAELGIALSFAWMSYPFTFFTLDSNSNDSLVALLLVLALLALRSRAGRGALIGLAAAAKFAPLALWPLFTAADDGDDGTRGVPALRVARFRGLLIGTAAVALVVIITFAPFIPAHGGLRTIYNRTVGYQATRDTPFSIWGQYHSLGWLWTVVKVATVALVVAVAIEPRRKDVVTCAGLGAALLIAVQLCAAYWFYLYIVWFLPLALVAFFGAHHDAPDELDADEDARRRTLEPALA